jgi:uncharacterized damage-inducible protein DinB
MPKTRQPKNAPVPTESSRIADQLHRAFYGDAWHGPAVMEVLADVKAATAIAKPLPDVHSIWELALHIEVWDRSGLVRLQGTVFQPTGLDNFPLPSSTPNETAWKKAVAQVKRTHDTLVKTIAALSDDRLNDRVPGKPYNFYHLFHGIAQHELYHAGQIAILKKAQMPGGKRR